MTALRARWRELQLALMLLTRLPAGRIEGEAPPLSAARWAFPLVGAGLGALGWVAHAAALASGAGPLVAALLAIAVLAALTGALHFDGLADFADGIGGGRDSAHCLEIMRDSRIGSYGVLALVLATGLWAAALADLDARASLLWFMAAGALSRAAIVILQETLPAARAEGMGRLAAGRNIPARGVVAALVLAMALGGPAGLVALAAGGAATLAVGTLARRRIGGQTGDVLGAAQLASEVAFWVGLSVML